MTEPNPEGTQTSDNSVTDQNSEVIQSDSPSHQGEPFDGGAHKSDAPPSVEFSIEDTNHDYAKGVFMRNARRLGKSAFEDLYREDPQATFRLTLERL